MKKNLYIVCLLAISAGAKAQNVGIGTTTPTTKLTVVNTGFGFEHNDGTISIKSFVGSGIGLFGTSTNHPFHLSANNTTGQLVIMPTGLIGIGNSNPTLAGLVADKKVGAVNAMFGGNTTGVALESNWPGVGFNSYWNGNRKYMANGFGGVIGFNPTNGYFTLASTVVSGTANAAATTTDILTATNTGNVGIGTSTPSAKLEVNGTFKLTDGTQGADKVLTSDAGGNTSWKTSAYGNTERFAFGYNYNNALGERFTTIYNTGTATASKSQSTINNILYWNVNIQFNKTGLYHLNINTGAVSFTGSATNAALYFTFGGSYLMMTGSAPFFSDGQELAASYDKELDVYIPTPGSYSFQTYVISSNPAVSLSFYRFFNLNITGHLVAD